MIHLANGGNNDLYHTVFDGLTEQGVEYDIIGLSYYSYWHGPMSDLINNMNEISARYGKPVIVAETAYAFTVNAGDEHGNLYGDGLQELVAWESDYSDLSFFPPRTRATWQWNGFGFDLLDRETFFSTKNTKNHEGT